MPRVTNRALTPISQNPLNVLQEIELAPVAGRSGHLPLPLGVIAYTLS
jgi:hypothetical protein